jgi:uncharacterized protein YndB with AHSA1/START domain
MITVSALVNAPVEKTWEAFTNPAHIVNWNNASPDWHTPYAENDLRVDGSFKYTMAAKDGSFSFDFEGIYTAITPFKSIYYTIADGRKVEVIIEKLEEGTQVIENFEAESVNPEEMQQAGWQAILTNFKNYVESL